MNTVFKKSALCVLISGLLTACVESDGGSDNREAGNAAGHDFVATGSIARVGEVDWYEFTTTEANQELAVHLYSKTVRPDIELLATLYKLDEQGKKVRLYADHSTENSVKTPEVKMAVVVDEPQKLFIAVRDLRDDEADGYDYALTIDAATREDRSSTFDDAVSLNEQCQQDVIGHKSDVDTFRFTVVESGVYRFITEYEKKDSSSPDLVLKLFDQSGMQISQVSQANVGGKTFAMVQHLTAGDYYVLAEDYGHNQFDTYSAYTVCASKSENSEVGQNDTLATATAVTLGRVIEGSLDYDKDQDWYQIPVQVSGNGDVNILHLEFDTQTAHGAYRYDVQVVDAQGNAIFTHSHNAVSGGFNTELKVDGAGPYYLVVTPIGSGVYSESDNGDVVTQAPYSAMVNTQTVSDTGESAGNDAIDNAYVLTAGESVSAKIAYRGDVDWYSLTLPADATRIVEVFLQSENRQSGGDVDYSLAIFDSQVRQILDDELGGDGPTTLKTSFIMPQRQDGENNTLSFRVKDILDNDADALSGYTLQVNVVDIPSALNGDGEFATAYYHNEASEYALKQQRDEDLVVLEDSDPNFDRRFADDRATFVFDGDNANPNFTLTTSDDGQTKVFTSPWVGGYVDYQGDQDFFKFHLAALTPTAQAMDEEGNPLVDEQGQPVLVAPDSTWYYDVKIELVAAATDVEYAWKIHKDLDSNKKIKNESQLWSSNADRTYSAEAIHLVSGAQGEIWGNQKAYAGDYYFKVGDYNMAGNGMNLYQDYDWGYAAPYYFRLVFTYHANKERAE